MSRQVGPDAPPVLRVARLDEIAQGDPEFERELLDCLIDDVNAGIDRLRESLASPDPTRLADLLHGVVGACRTVGADALGASSRALESEAREPGFAPGPGWLDRVECEFARLRAVVAARCGP